LVASLATRSDCLVISLPSPTPPGANGCWASDSASSLWNSRIVQSKTLSYTNPCQRKRSLKIFRPFSQDVHREAASEVLVRSHVVVLRSRSAMDHQAASRSFGSHRNIDLINSKNSFFFRPSKCSSLASNDNLSVRLNPVARRPVRRRSASIVPQLRCDNKAPTCAVEIFPTGLTPL
jgi:hypothetical protein